ncbi:hypothetical protein ZYGR_0A02040 [Zygosaccharomyces rouxii]|uniref:GPI mannosyltransferase 2 n=2 Tax=Zygosaccharomyces rouxii TaxID=4956 RepID=C5DPM8_ZYGRC|nr:uncharacterized protein ZYRO0A04642g [Zygosaccharomyces rouxii]KAH9198841.1 GPI mannosyltransferase 2 [Zygosaccharomyces rouxii]GAV46611.1 hypothetical protein ZYGR_0A02040 [Zygosaccharomyces rouxii]CAR25639.1 ZYRO0A04642p [Zygosaccharomyces rouxii]
MFCQLSSTFILCKLVQYGLILLTPRDQFDTSTELLLARFVSVADSSKFWNSHLWNKLLAWDSVYFMKAMASENGKPAFEHEFAFSQFWIHLVRFLAPNHEFYNLLKTGVVLDNILHYLATFILYFLTVKIFSGNLKSSYAKSLAKKTSVLFIFSSAAGFLTGIYSEPLSFTLSFLGIWARQSAVFTTLPKHIDCLYSRFPLYLFSAICFSLATLNRSNCIVLGIYYVFDLWQLLKNRNYGKALLFPLLSGGILFLTCVLQQYVIPYSIFCPERGSWCNTQILGPFTRQSFYGFLQSHYWNVGFLKYWTPNNIPNFLFALPNIIILLYSSVYFSKIYPYYSLRPHIWVTTSLVIIVLLFAHVQIINRISTFIPLHLWYIADRLLKTSNSKDKSTPRGDDRIAHYYIIWLIFWIPLQTILFAYFLPPA